MEASEFKALFLPYHALLYRTAYALLGNADDAEDIVQDAYLKLWDKRDRLDIRSNTGAYCVTLVRRLCLDHMQASRYKSEEPLPADVPIQADDNPERTAEQHDTHARLRQLIAGLPAQQRKVLWLRDVHECTFEEIEQATGLTPVNIRATLSRARKRIREQFNRLTGKRQ